jgi:hypothetical protein
VYLVTADRRRQWVQNVLARPGVELRVDGEMFRGAVEPVIRPDEVARVVELLKRKYWLSRAYLWDRGAPDAAFRVRVDNSRVTREAADREPITWDVPYARGSVGLMGVAAQRPSAFG